MDPKKFGSRQENRTTREVVDSTYVEGFSSIESDHVITTTTSHSDAFAKGTMDTASTPDEYQELLFSREEYEKRNTPEAPGEDTTGIWSRTKRAQFFQNNEINRRYRNLHSNRFEGNWRRTRGEASLQAILFDPPPRDFSNTECNVQTDGARGVKDGYLEPKAHIAHGEEFYSKEPPFFRAVSSWHDSMDDDKRHISFSFTLGEAIFPRMSSLDSPSTASTDSRSADLKEHAASNELVVDVDSSGMEGVLDAICLVESEAAGRHGDSDYALMVVTNLSLTKLVETKVQIAVNARESYADQQHLYVLID
ncbi:hypothetical protein BWQ96_10276 [Gracilariopsis chorda]|uniref:Uncharacterized protein n=1 Tax=Gracilariopsis chorda TaxID=448386 RepID=A0A2V3ID50_9FLOR|nr:hypothetical protein BWQ96_10276 [Gracilariopsis chorda]|eukprot:PXF40013.1 hypothetical protein BWQ96_10276 [Gracilariopsis chorda]